MPNVNLIVLCGNLTKDWEIQYTPTGVAVGKGGMAVNKKWKDGTGQMREKVCFVDLVAFKKTAEVLAEHTRKGACIHVVGELDFDQWEDKQTGAKRSKHKVTVQSFQFMDRAPAADGQAAAPRQAAPAAQRPAAPAQQQRQAPPAQQTRPATQPHQMTGEDLGIPDEEIPF
jgi:single-strand DNA-binding protein